jgi:Ca2+/H+ antiporter
LQAQLEQRLLPDHARQIQDELATAKAERDQLAQQIQRLAAPWRTWLLIGLIIVVAILATLLVSVFAFGAR